MEQTYSKTGFDWSGEAYAAANSIQASVGKRLIGSVYFRPDMSVLDAGCGSGDLTLLLAGMVLDGQVLAVDSSASMNRKAEEFKAARNIQNVEFRVCGINEIDLSEQFDVVFSNSVLHWVTETEDGLRRLFAALKKGGLLAAQFPLLNAEHPLIRYAERAIDELGFRDRCEGRRFPWYVPDSAEQFAGLFEKAGFADTEVFAESDLFTFPSAEAVYRHFSSVGLDLLAAPLCVEEKENFITESWPI